MIRIVAIDYDRKLFFINPKYIVEFAETQDGEYWVQLTTRYYLIDKLSFITIRQHFDC